MRIPSGTTDQYIYFVAVDITDLKTREDGLTSFTVYRSRNGAAAAAMTTPTVNEVDATNMPGVYELLLDEDMTIGSGNDSEEYCVHITQAAMAPVTRVFELYRPKITAGNTLDVTSTGAAGIDWGNIENKTTANDLSGTDIQLCDTVTTTTTTTTATNLTNLPNITANWLTAAGIAAGALDGKGDWNVGKTGYSISGTITTLDGLNNVAATDIVSAGAITTLTGAVVNVDLVDTVTTNTDLVSAASIADAVWDEDIVAAHTTADTAGLILANTRNLATGAGGISAVQSSFTKTQGGTETNTAASTEALDGTYHIIPANGTPEIDVYYEFDVGVTGVATEIIWDGYATTNNDVVEVYGYDWVAAGWSQVGSIDGGSANSTEATYIFTTNMTGTGANAGTVRCRFASSGGDTATNLATDRILCEYTSLPEAGVVLHSGVAQAGTSNSITLDTGANANDDFYNHASIVISSGTGSEQERIIVDYNGTTKVATIAPPWVTQPDSTSAFEVEPGTVHAETGWGTIKVGLAAAATTTTVTLDSNASATNDYYNGDLVFIDSGTGEGQVRVITDYVGATKVATVHETWTTTPDTTSEYVIETAHPYVDAKTSDIKTKTDSLTFTVSNQVDANIQSVNDVTVTGDGQSGTEWGP